MDNRFKAELGDTETVPGGTIDAVEESKNLLRSVSQAYVETELKKHYKPELFDEFKAACWVDVMDRIEKSIILPAKLEGGALSVEDARYIVEHSTLASWVRPIFEMHRIRLEEKQSVERESKS